MVGRGYGWIEQFGQIVDAIGRFSQLLDMNCDAMYGSFSSVLRLFESMAELRREVLFLFQTFTVFKLLQALAHRLNNFGRSLRGKPPLALTGEAGSLDLDSFDSFQSAASSASSGMLGPHQQHPHHPQQPRPRRVWPFLLFFVSALCGPIIINRLWRLLKESAGTDAQQQQQQQEQAFWDGQELFARALYDFAGEGPRDLPFRQGDIIRVVERLPGEWWEGSIDGRTGQFPLPYVQIIEPQQQQQQQRSQHQFQSTMAHKSMDDQGMEPLKLHLNTPSD